MHGSMSPRIRFLLLPLILLAVGTHLFAWGADEVSPTADSEAVESGEFDEPRIRMVRNQIESRDVRNGEVLRAMRAVPRHLFVPPEYVSQAYDDHALPIGFGQTISQPYIVAYMTELLEIEPGDAVLEIGTGSG